MIGMRVGADNGAKSVAHGGGDAIDVLGQVGPRIDDDVVARLADDVGVEVGGLPAAKVNLAVRAAVKDDVIADLLS